jgi:hypothetical protein
MASNQTIYRGSPHLNLGTPNYYQVSNKAITSNVATISTSVVHNITSVGNLAVIQGVDSTIDGTHIVASIPTLALDFPGPGSNTFTYGTTAGNVSTAAVSPTGQLIWNNYYTGGTVTNIAIVNYIGTVTTGAAHGLVVGDIVGVETSRSLTLGSRVLTVPTSTTFTFEGSTQTLANAAATGAWTKIPPVYIAPTDASKKINNIVVTNKLPSTGTYSIYIGGFPIAENIQINANTTNYIDLEQVMFNGDKLILCASNNDIKFHISGENV